MSWKPEVLVDGKWSANGMAFASEREAQEWAYDLLRRWSVPMGARAVESDQPVNYKIVQDEHGAHYVCSRVEDES